MWRYRRLVPIGRRRSRRRWTRRQGRWTHRRWGGRGSSSAGGRRRAGFPETRAGRRRERGRFAAARHSVHDLLSAEATLGKMQEPLGGLSRGHPGWQHVVDQSHLHDVARFVERRVGDQQKRDFEAFLGQHGSQLVGVLDVGRGNEIHMQPGDDRTKTGGSGGLHERTAVDQEVEEVEGKVPSLDQYDCRLPPHAAKNSTS